MHTWPAILESEDKGIPHIRRLQEDGSYERAVSLDS